METKITGTIGPVTKKTILDEIDSIQSKLPFLINLKADDRHNLAKMGDKTLAFVTKGLDYAKQNPTIVPPFLDVTQFENEVNVVTDLSSIMKSIRQLLEKIDDTTMLAGSEAYASALVFYNAVKSASKVDVPGMKSIYEDLQTRFPGRGKSNHPDEE
ncbi:hypothetical protein [Williamwhitmania taraxaci]|uniref:Uncharacterized protein n=1 Tax=Williamwhitmania taraxaci TaxID=1640674 RepID=A0A1G6THU4_9BACT|nr:hypothetical protein [Williamwhitmania taraxaci]SDD27997.1 hypothetical protein SAMN05216323_11223 [Williamwhitmania taraxaci]